MAKPPEAAIGCEATPEGRVKLFFIEKGKTRGGIDMPPEAVAGIAATLFAAAIKAAEISGQSHQIGSGASLAGTPTIVPTALGLSAGLPPEPMALVVHAGMARFGIALPNPRELGEALLAASAPQERRQ